MALTTSNHFNVLISGKTYFIIIFSSHSGCEYAWFLLYCKMVNSFVSCLYPLNTVCKLLALTHYNADLKKLSKFWLSYSILFVCSMCCLSIIQLASDLTNKNNTKLFKFVSFIRIASPTVTRTLIIFAFMFKYKTLLHFISCIAKIENVMSRALRVPRSNKLYVKFQIIVIFLIICAVVSHSVLTFVLNGWPSAVLSTFVIISYLSQAQFVSCVLLLNMYIGLIINKLSESVQKKKHLSEISSMFGSQQYPDIWNITIHSTMEVRDREQIVVISKELIRYISILKEDLSSYFSFPMLLVVADNLLITTFNLYMLIKNISSVFNYNDAFNQIGFLYTVCLNVIQVLFIAFPCAAANKKVSLT